MLMCNQICDLYWFRKQQIMITYRIYLISSFIFQVKIAGPVDLYVKAGSDVVLRWAHCLGKFDSVLRNIGFCKIFKLIWQMLIWLAGSDVVLRWAAHISRCGCGRPVYVVTIAHWSKGGSKLELESGPPSLLPCFSVHCGTGWSGG